MSQALPTPPPPAAPASAPDIDVLVTQAATLKARIDKEKEQLRVLSERLAELAVFPDGKSTAHIVGGGYNVAIQRKSAVKWDQDKLNQARAVLKDETFFALFAWEYKPKSAEAVRGFLEHADPQAAALVRAARTVSECAPYVTYTPLNQKGEE